MKTTLALAAAAIAASSLVLARGAARAEDAPHPAGHGVPAPAADAGYRPVRTPNGSTLPFHVVDGVKVFHLVAEEVTHEFAPGLVAKCWGYNGQVHGPTIEAVEGDRVRIYVTNRLPAPTTIHWHGMHVPNGMDGVAGLTQRAIEPGETFRYEFTLRQHGTFMYHPHFDEMVQMAMGLMGVFVVHPKAATQPVPDRDYVYLLSEWAIPPGATRPDPFEMTDFNVLTLNARVFPGTEPMVAKVGDLVRIRIANLSAMDHHPMHIHGTSFRVVETDGGEIPEAGQWPETTVLVPVGSTRTIEFRAESAGDWAFHCHMTHHTMTQMGHGLPNLVGVDQSAFDQKVLNLVVGPASKGLAPADAEAFSSMPKNTIAMLGGTGPFGYIPMGGMFTVLKVRESLSGDADPGWYEHPAGTVASPASPDELRRDGVSPDERPAGPPSPTPPPPPPPPETPATPPSPHEHHR